MVIRNTSGCVLLVVTDSRPKAAVTSSRKHTRIRKACIANQPSTVSALRCRFPPGTPARSGYEGSQKKLSAESEQLLAQSDDLPFDVGGKPCRAGDEERGKAR